MSGRGMCLSANTRVFPLMHKYELDVDSCRQLKVKQGDKIKAVWSTASTPSRSRLQSLSEIRVTHQPTDYREQGE